MFIRLSYILIIVSIENEFTPSTVELISFDPVLKIR